MKKNKKGFSLAEVLIALGIISVIATLGFTITKNSIERAYDLYIYNGYSSITNAIADANANGILLTQTDPSDTEFEKHIIDLFDGKKEGAYIKAPNGIQYKFIHWGTTFTPEHHEHYIVEMKTPAPKKIINNDVTANDTTCFLYYPTREYGILVPIDNASSCKSTITGLGDRIDLLPFYIDDGLVGRTIPDIGYTKKHYYSAYDAICAALGGEIDPYLSATIKDCDIDKRDVPLGAIRVENPRKAFY